MHPVGHEARHQDPDVPADHGKIGDTSWECDARRSEHGSGLECMTGPLLQLSLLKKSAEKLWSTVYRWVNPPKSAKCIMIGLDAAGKTTILYKLKLGKVDTTIPTIGFNVETVEYKNILFKAFDVGGKDKIRPLWRGWCQDANAIIFVVDSNDRARMEDNSYEIHRLLNEDQTKDALFLVYANKVDLPNAMKAAEVTDKLGLHSLRSRRWYIQLCQATNGDGLYEGLDWLASMLKR
ncbi:hypothetical protein CYMTET_10257 [Cymbomonas tetramitiformis]|uniref:ADP-ribosylation factor n=1 Tax=Cymbomonas tetramitiformis TaxID=36881 RepID=A0AAE0GPZ7_9CHLO|nr:hypothetical protein CYMTET_10257 [Cymbomonas tetramitiformis]